MRFQFGDPLELLSTRLCSEGEVVDERILTQRRKGQLRVGTDRGGEEVEGQDVPQGSGGAKIEGPSPRGVS